MAGAVVMAVRNAGVLSPVGLGLIGLVLAGVFDTIHVNQQTANLLFILLGVSVKMRPRERAG
jgi:hypothetical protein